MPEAIKITKAEVRVLLADHALKIVNWAHNQEVATSEVLVAAIRRMQELVQVLED